MSFCTVRYAVSFFLFVSHLLSLSYCFSVCHFLSSVVTFTRNSMNTLGRSILTVWPNIFLFKASCHTLGWVCKFVQKCKKFYLIGPSYMLRHQKSNLNKKGIQRSPKNFGKLLTNLFCFLGSTMIEPFPSSRLTENSSWCLIDSTLT